jgi:hypothetical protein
MRACRQTRLIPSTTLWSVHHPKEVKREVGLLKKQIEMPKYPLKTNNAAAYFYVQLVPVNCGGKYYKVPLGST